jgi:hypothetical protein
MIATISRSASCATVSPWCSPGAPRRSTRFHRGDRRVLSAAVNRESDRAEWSRWPCFSRSARDASCGLQRKNCSASGRIRENPGSLTFRARCVPTCQGHRPRRTPTKLAMALGRMLPSALCRGVGVLKFGVSRGSITWPVVPPVYASYPALRPCAQDSEPAWLAKPSPYDSFIRYILPDRCYSIVARKCAEPPGVQPPPAV